MGSFASYIPISRWCVSNGIQCATCCKCPPLGIYPHPKSSHRPCVSCVCICRCGYSAFSHRLPYLYPHLGKTSLTSHCFAKKHDKELVYTTWFCILTHLYMGMSHFKVKLQGEIRTLIVVSLCLWRVCSSGSHTYSFLLGNVNIISTFR